MPHELMSVGTFRARAVQADLTKSSQKGTPGVEVECEVVGGDEDGGRVVWTGWLSERAFNRTVESLRHMGWQGDDLSDLSTVGSAQFDITVEEEEYNGKIRFKIAWVNAAGSGGPVSRAMTQDEKKAFAAKMRGQVIAASGTTAKPAAKKAAKPAAHPNAPPDFGAPPIEDDDIGF